MGIQGSFQLKITENYTRNVSIVLEDFYNANTQNKPVFEINELNGLIIQSKYPVAVQLSIEKPDSTLLSFNADAEEQEICAGWEDSFVPGDYQINVVYNSKRIETFFRVKATALTSKQLYDLRSAIESFQSGLTKDIFTKKISSDFLTYNSSIKSQYLTLQRLEKYEKALFRQLDQVLQNPQMSIKKGYQLGAEERKQDFRSERWLETKGERKNVQNENQSQYLNKHTLLDYQSNENQKLKKELLELYLRVISLVKSFEQKSNFYSTYCDHIKADIIEKREYLQNTNVEAEKKSIQKDIDRREREIQEFLEKIKVVNSKISFLMSSKMRIIEALENYWLSKVKVVNSHKNYLPTNESNYQRLFKILEDIKGTQVKFNEITFDVDSQFRRTPYLFEVYNLLLMHSALLDLGYQPVDTDIFQMNYGFIDAIIESTLIYRLGKKRIEVRYDKQIPKYARSTKSDFYNVNAWHNRPDILVAKFDVDSEELLDAFVVEIKCVKEHYLYSGYQNTNLIEHFKDYLSFAYLDKRYQDPILKKGVIRKVIVVYPSLNEDSNITEFGQIEYLGLNPSIVPSETNLYRFFQEEIMSKDT